ncbi:MAG: DegT/DnrJ/EryC1/StrS family aminotransferase, partial [Ignavibacteria bacterium]|nr:DegT/DnrJ/EryC1/StrS family aminotransferase [Ignavibacteria bacterium]
HEISARRYFYPSLSSLNYTEGDCSVSDQIAARILCLPLYHTLSDVEQKMIARILLRVQNN